MAVEIQLSGNSVRQLCRLRITRACNVLVLMGPAAAAGTMPAQVQLRFRIQRQRMPVACRRLQPPLHQPRSTAHSYGHDSSTDLAIAQQIAQVDQQRIRRRNSTAQALALLLSRRRRSPVHEDSRCSTQTKRYNAECNDTKMQQSQVQRYQVRYRYRSDVPVALCGGGISDGAVAQRYRTSRYARAAALTQAACGLVLCAACGSFSQCQTSVYERAERVVNLARRSCCVVVAMTSSHGLTGYLYHCMGRATAASTLALLPAPSRCAACGRTSVGVLCSAATSLGCDLQEKGPASSRWLCLQPLGAALLVL
jgi:hypothetical protein